MDQYSSLFLFLAFVSLLTSIGIALYAGAHTQVRGAIPFALFGLAAAEWTFGYLAESMSASLPIAIFWDNFQRIGVDLVPLAILLFAVEYTGRKQWLTRRTYILLAVFPIVDWIVTATNPLHGWAWSAPELIKFGSLSVLEYTYGFWLWVLVVYNYILLAITLYMLLRRFKVVSAFYRPQIVIIIVGMIIPWIGSMVRALDGLPGLVAHLDITPIAFMFGNAVWAWGLFRYRLLDMVPIALETVIENMHDGIIVMDATQRIVDLNPVARRVIGVGTEHVIGQSLFDVWQPGRQWLSESIQLPMRVDTLLSVDGVPCHFDVRISQLRESHGETSGYVLILHDITERQSTQAALQESERYVRRIIDSSADMIITTDTQRRIVEFNDAAQEIFGYTRDEMLGSHIDRLYANTEDGEKIRRALLQDGKFSGEVLNKRKNGETFVSSLTASTLRSANGQVLGVVGVSRDITESKRAEARRRSEEEVYQSIFDNAVEGIFQSSPVGRFISVNPALARMWGYDSPEDLIDRITNIAEQVYVNPARRDEFQRQIDEHGETHAFEYQAWRKDGSKIWVSENARTVRNADGTILYYEGTIENITARKQAEEALRESEERFSGAFEHASIGMALVSPEGRWLKVNHALCELTGYTESELLAKTVQEITHPDDLEADLAYVRQMLAGEIHTYQMEKRYFHKLGRIVWILLSVSLVRDARGEPLHFIAQIQDITARKRDESDLQQRADEFAALYDTTRDLAKMQDLDTLLKTIVERAIHLLKTTGGAMYLYDAARYELEVKVATHPSISIGTRLQMGEGMAGRVAQSRQPLIVDDYRTWEGRSSKYAGTTLTAIAEVPMLFGGELVGVLVVMEEGETNRKFTTDDAQLLALFAGQAASAVHNARSMAEHQKRADELAALYNITRDLATQQDLSTLLQIIVDRATTLFNTPGAFVYLYDPVEHNMELRLIKGSTVPLGTHLKLGEGMAGRVAQSKEPLIIDDYQSWEHRSSKYDGMPWRATLEVPMLYSGEFIGVVAVYEIGASTRKFTDADVRLLALFASHAASAIYNAQLFDKVKHRADEFTALYDISRDLTLQQDLPSLLHTIVERASALLSADGGGIYLYESERDHLAMVTPKGTDIALGVRLKMGEGMAGRVAQTRQPMIVDDYSQWEHRSLQFDGIPIHAAIHVPMLYGGELIGVLAVHESKSMEHKFTESDERILFLFAGQAASAVHDARLLDETRARARRQEALHHISTNLTRIRQPSELCEAVVQACHDSLAYGFMAIFLIEPSTGDRVLQAHYGWENAITNYRLRPGEGLSERAVRTGELQYWHDVTTEPQYVSSDEGFHSELDVPIKAGDSILGVLIAEDARADAFGKDDFEILQAVANQLAVALENTRLYEEQKHLSITDGLTGLYNRRYFMELAQREFDRAHRLNSPCALLMLDLNNFKYVNDTFGHAAGDQALQLAAKTLTQNVRAVDVVARYGGDEFVVLLPNCQHSEARLIAARLEKETRTVNLTVRNRMVEISFSLGIAVATLAPEETFDDMLEFADSEMYLAKSKWKKTTN